MDKEQYRRIARGVTLRTYRSGRQAFQIQFMYKGIRCNETLKVKPGAQGEKYTVRLLAEIEGAIERKTFNYQSYFPESKKAALFGHSVSNEAVGDAIETWLIDIRKSQRSSTYNTYRKRVNKLRQAEIWKLRKRDVTGQVVRDLVRGWDGLSTKTIGNLLIPLRAVFDQAVADREMAINPVDGVKVAKLVTRKPKSPPADPFEYDELLAIIAKFGELYGELFRNAVSFSFFQGLRTSELFGLQWRDIDWKAGTAAIRRGRVERILEEETKTAAGDRLIDLTVGGHDALVRQRPLSQARSEFVFLRPSGRPFISYDDLSAPWGIVLRSLKIRHRKPYQARHTFASTRLSHGENLFYMTEQVGHKDPQMLLKVYGKWIRSAKSRSDMPPEFVLKVHSGYTQKRTDLISN